MNDTTTTSSSPSRFRTVARQLSRRSPFSGTIAPGRVPLLAPFRGRPTLPVPTPWNFKRPLRILDTFFWGADEIEGAGRHTRYIDPLGFRPVLVTRDPELIKAISSDTGAKPGQFDRDTMPSAGIARATGEDSLLYANGPAWKRQKQLVAPAFSKGTLFQPERFGEFESTFRSTVAQRLGALRTRIGERGGPVEVRLEPEIQALMLEMLANCFFGASIPYDEVRNRYVPALDRVIDDIVRDTVINRLGLKRAAFPALTPRARRARANLAIFEELVDRVLEPRREGQGSWEQFNSDASDDALRSNLRVFLAGALEATTSFAGWAISHLARRVDMQRRVREEVAGIDRFDPEALRGSPWLLRCLDETLRLTPSLYFHPRRPTVDTTVTTAPGESLVIPAGTHILLDVWHANRHEDHWGVASTGFPATDFAPERWERLERDGIGANQRPHFGFGHGPRFCPGKNLGQLEVALVVGACIKLFEFRAANEQLEARAGVSTKPADGVLVELTPLQCPPDPRRTEDRTATPTGCPFSGESQG